MKHPLLMKLAINGWRAGLLVAAVTTPLVLVFGSPNNLKSALDDSGAYTLAADTLSQTAVERTSSLTNLPVGKETVQQAAKETFTPDAIRSTTTNAIDGMYSWLEGKTKTPDVRINASDYTDKFASTLTGKATQQIAGSAPAADNRPACTLEQLQRTVASAQATNGDTTALNQTNLPCSPTKGVNDLVSQAVQGKTQQAGNSALEDSLRNSALPANTTSGNGASKDIVLDSSVVTNKYDYLPVLYTLNMLAPWIFGGLAILSAAAVILLSHGGDLRAGVRSLARSLLGAGIAVVILAALSRLIVSFLAKPDGTISRFIGSFGRVAVNFISALEHKLDTILFVFGATYVGVAAVTLIYLRWQARQGTVTTVATPDSPLK